MFQRNYIGLTVQEVSVVAGDRPTLPQADYRQCKHEALVRNGLDPTVKRGKAQRFKCMLCGHEIVAGADPLIDKRIRIARGLLRGLSVRAVARRTRTSREAVRFVRRILGARRPAVCRCGRPVGHAGRARRNCAT